MIENKNSPYEEHSWFYEEDNRRGRELSPVTRETLEKKHAVLLPPNLVKGKSVLDLGSCMGATGQWSLFYGAESYTWVETQIEYVERSRRLLAHHGEKAKIVHSGITEFLEKNERRFDIVCLFGVIYAFVDCYGLLGKACAASDKYVVIESLYPNLPKGFLRLPLIQILPAQRINLANDSASLVGVGTRITPVGIKMAMANFGFASREGVMHPEPIVGSLDIYQPIPSPQKLREMFPNEPSDDGEEMIAGNYLHGFIRFMMRFEKIGKKLPTLEASLISDRAGPVMPW